MLYENNKLKIIKISKRIKEISEFILGSYKNYIL